MRAVILGATGFLGSNLVSEFLKRDVDIVSFSPKSDRSRILEHHGVKVVHGDFLKRETLDDIPLNDVDWLVHFASTTNPMLSMLEPHTDEANLRASRIIFQKAIDSGVKRILFSSSGGTVYGDARDGTVKETEETRPSTPYATTKLAIENDLVERCRETNTIPIILRYGNPFGPNQYPVKGTGVVVAWLEAVRDSKPIMLFGEGKAARDFVYVSDAIDAAIMALTSKESRGVYNIGSGVATTLFELALAIGKVTKKRLDVNKVPPRPSDVVSTIALDTSRARNYFGWNAKVGLDEGIRKTWKWVKMGEPFVVG
jgi:UDP-glucose 4-epimerase